MRPSRFALLVALAATPVVGCSDDDTSITPGADVGATDTADDTAADTSDAAEDVADTADTSEDVADAPADTTDAGDATDAADAADAPEDTADTADAADTTDAADASEDTADAADAADATDTDADTADTDAGVDPNAPPDTDDDGVAGYPWGGDIDDDDDGVPYGRDVDDADDTVGLPNLDGAALAWDYVGGFTAGAGVTGMISGDFDRDGHMDVATTDQDSGSVTVFLSDGARGFDKSTILLPDPDDSGGGTITTFDADGDGDLDIVFERIFVAYNDGDGGFAAPVVLTSGDVTTFFPWDVDGDGFLDLATVAYHGRATVTFGGEDGLAGDPVETTVSDMNAYGAFATIDGDVPVDMWITSGNDDIEFVAGNADGTFDATVALTEYDHPYACEGQVGDFDGDGSVDLVTFDCIGATGATIGFGAGDGTLTDPESFGTSDVHNGCVADFDGDGTDDVVVPGSVVNLVLGGESSRTLTAIDGERSGRLCTTGDFDGDGLMDVAVSAFDGVMSFYFARAESD